MLVAGIPRGGVSVLFFRPLVFLGALGISIGLIACDQTSKETGMVRDDFGDAVPVRSAPKRIVSLNPATTEILFTIGAGQRLVGRSDYDLWPDSARLVKSLGSGLRPNVEAVLGVHPDLVVLYASQDNKPAVDAFHAARVATLALRTDHIADFRRTVSLLGAVVNDSARSQTVIDSVYRTIDRVRRATEHAPRPTVFWHIWDSPLITIGSGSFMSELVEVAGARNV